LAAICPGGVAGCDVAPNYLNVHVYAKNLEKFQKQVNDWHDQFGMNLVLTEFAYDVLGANSEGPEPTPEKASAFMSESKALMAVLREAQADAYIRGSNSLAGQYLLHPVSYVTCRG